MLARGVSRRSKVQCLAIRTLRRMFSYIELPRALGRSEALVTRMVRGMKCIPKAAMRVDTHLLTIINAGFALVKI